MLCFIHAQVIDVKHASFSSNCQTYLDFDPSYINHRIMYGIYYTMNDAKARHFSMYAKILTCSLSTNTIQENI